MNNLAYQKDQSYEMINGKIFSMSPRPSVNHNVVSGNIYRIISTFLRGKHCTAFSDGVDVFLNDNDRVIPDVMIVCNRNIIKPDGIHGAPDLIVEVLSPSTAKNDKGIKKDLYEKSGVKEYWIADTANQSIEVYLLENDNYSLNNVYAIYPDYELGKMTDEEKQEVITKFKTSLYDDLIIDINEVFENLF